MCTKGVYKWSLVLFNVIFVVLGILTLAVGLFVKYKAHHMDDDLAKLTEEMRGFSNTLSNVSMVLIVIGAVMFGLGFVGCCGAWKELRLFLVVYAIIIGLVFVVQIVAAIVVMAFKNDLNYSLTTVLTENLQGKYQDGIHMQGTTFEVSNDTTSMAWDSAQISLECCGVTGPDSYQNTTKWNNKYTINGQTIDAKVPISCCRISNPYDFPDQMGQLDFTDLQKCLTTAQPDATNTDGCYTMLVEELQGNSMILVGIAIGIGFVELLGIMFACLLCQAIQKESYNEV